MKVSRLSAAAFLLISLTFIPGKVLASESAIPRKIIALYDKREEYIAKDSKIHRFIEMPLNHLGYVVDYYEISETHELPVLGDDVAGIITWYRSATDIANPDKYLDWMSAAADSGKKIIILGQLGITAEYRDTKEGLEKINHLLEKLGLQDQDEWINLTYEYALDYKDPLLIGFEKPVSEALPPFDYLKKIGSDATSHLRIKSKTNPGIVSDAVITGPNGGYAVGGYEIFAVYDEDNFTSVKSWIINPFEFLEMSLNPGIMPVPDTSTLNGRRIFYGHIDGDGWNNISDIPEYKKEKAISASVLKKEIFDKYPDLPFTVGLIVSEIDVSCYGFPESEKVAREILALPNIEPSSHTLSHPLYWEYFADGDPWKEKVILDKYPPRPGKSDGLFAGIIGGGKEVSWEQYEGKITAHKPDEKYHDYHSSEEIQKELKIYYGVPRSYACEPFDLQKEIQGSVDFIKKLAPEGKQVRLYQWSGNTTPFEEAVAETRKAGLRNINGGDSRYDPEYPSYAWVSPLGIQVGGERQVYSSNSNENTYTKEWKDRYYGFRFLRETTDNTESPIRIKPFNIYFHMFSGEKQASLSAIKENAEYAASKPLIPITASDYAAIADGFYSAKLTRISQNSWRIENRDALQTLRFDNASDISINFAASKGVIGQRYYQGSLYIALDPSESSPVIIVNKPGIIEAYPESELPYLLESNWKISHVDTDSNRISFIANGFGKGLMIWKVKKGGKYEIVAEKEHGGQYKTVENADGEGLLRFTLEFNALNPVKIDIKLVNSGETQGE